MHNAGAVNILEATEHLRRAGCGAVVTLGACTGPASRDKQRNKCPCPHTWPAHSRARSTQVHAGSNLVQEEANVLVRQRLGRPDDLVQIRVGQLHSKKEKGGGHMLPKTGVRPGDSHWSHKGPPAGHNTSPLKHHTCPEPYTPIPHSLPTHPFSQQTSWTM